MILSVSILLVLRSVSRTVLGLYSQATNPSISLSRRVQVVEDLNTRGVNIHTMREFALQNLDDRPRRT